MRTIILGAGFTGMAASIKTGAQVYEASKSAGGICRTYVKDGFEFDTGGPHWLFGENKAIDFVRTLVQLNTYERNVGVYTNTIFPYPIQSFTQRDFETGTGTMKEWFKENFSLPECNIFFNPFNEKYTAGLMDEIIQYDAYKTPTNGSTGYVHVFHNPVGGLNKLVDIMAHRSKITYNKRAVAVNFTSKSVKFQDGEEVRYDRLISTIPLNQMLMLCGRQNFDLPYSSVFVLNIGATKGPMWPSQHWLYVPFCRSLFHRLGFYTNVEPSKAPEGMVSLSVEIAFSPEHDYWELDVPYITRNVVEELQNWNFIKDVVVTDPTWVKTAYTWNRTLDERERHLEWLKERNIIMLGRYGTWKFGGLCESIQQGLGVEV